MWHRKQGVISVKLPIYAWQAIGKERRFKTDGRMSQGAWFREFIRAHHHDPIVWPTGVWLAAHGEGGVWRSPEMETCLVSVGHDAWGALRERTLFEPGSPPMATVLRRLVCAYLGCVPDPSETVPHFGGQS